MSSNHKFESNKKYFTISIYTIAVILIGCVIFRFITQWSNTSKLISQLWEILFPFFMGFLIAYILNPVVAFFQRNVSIKLLKKKSASTQRGLAILISYLVMERSLSTRSLVFSAHPWDWLEVWQVNI